MVDKPSLLPLPDKSVTIRWLALDTIEAHVWPRLLQVLDPAERSRAERFHFERDRQAYIAAHALTRTTLSRHAPRPPEAWRFIVGPHGKPEIDEPQSARPLRFNLSHTHGLAAVAVTRRHDVGVDVERVDPRRLGPDVTDSFFAPAESEHLRSLPSVARIEAAYAFWTLKEAYIKAIGLGLACPLDAFDFVLDPLSVRFSAGIADDPAHWLFRRLRPTQDHVLALAARSARPDHMRVDARAARADELPD